MDINKKIYLRQLLDEVLRAVRQEAFEEAAKVVEHSGGFDTHVRAQLAAAIRARGEGK